jgi:LuxR family transcriptional regulator, maltose regulon positive regulatory protein
MTNRNSFRLVEVAPAERNCMKASVTPPKITRPTSSRLFARSRLFRVLDRSLTQSVVWVSGPPGTGKTSLVTSYLDARDLSCLWYQVDEGDSDLASFFYYLGLAAKKAAPRKKTLPLLTPEHHTSIRIFSRRFFENLYSRLIGIFEDGRMQRIIVFDNYQEVADGLPFHEILCEGVSLLPDPIKLVLISRTDPPAPFIRLRANRQMRVLGWEELRFTLDECSRLVRLRGNKEVSPNVLEQLHEKTDGWAAGIVLLLEGARNGGIESVLSKVHTSKEIFQYFAKEIFNRADSVTQEFLLKTSFFPQISTRMAEALTGNSLTQPILSELNVKNYFTQRLESETALYQYHPMFREFLQLLCSQTIDPESLIDIQREAARILMSEGYHENAIELLLKATAWDDAVEYILDQASNLATKGRTQTLEGWIRDIPQQAVEDSPWLLYWAGVCRLPFCPPESHPLFEKAFQIFRSRRDPVGTFLALSGLFDSMTYSLSRYQPFDSIINLLNEVMQEFPVFPSVEIEARLTASMLHSMVLRKPQNPEFEKTAERALSLLQKIPDQYVKMQILQGLLYQRLFSGEVEKGTALFEYFQGVLRRPDLPAIHKILLRCADSFHHWLRAEFKQCREAAEEGLELAYTTGVHLADAYLMGHAATGALNAGDLGTADAFIKRMSVSLDQMTFWGREFYHLLCAWRTFIQGDFSTSLLHTQMCLELDAGVPLTEVNTHFIRVLALHELKREAEALSHLERCQDIATSTGSPMAEFMCQIAKSKLDFDTGDDPSGLVSLKKALSLGREKGYLSTFFWIPSIIAELCHRALKAGIEIDYVRQLIRKRNLMPEPPPVDCEQWPWELKIYTLGRFHIERKGERLQFSGKAQKRPLEMVKSIISNGCEISEESLTDILWPDSAGDAGHSAFTTTVSRLRRLIGAERAIRVHNGIVSLDLRYCWVDAVAFERTVALIDQATHKEIKDGDCKYERAIALAEKAVGLYRGHFLPNDTGQFWTISYRERLRSKFSRLITKTGVWLEKLQDWEKALELYQEGLDADDLSEEFYQRAMVCHRELGQCTKAIDLYKRCKNVLFSNMGIEPSTGTKQIYETLIVRQAKAKPSNSLK